MNRKRNLFKDLALLQHRFNEDMSLPSRIKQCSESQRLHIQVKALTDMNYNLLAILRNYSYKEGE